MMVEKKIQLTPEMVEKIEFLLKKGHNVEVKIEHGAPVIIEITRRRAYLESESTIQRDHNS